MDTYFSNQGMASSTKRLPEGFIVGLKPQRHFTYLSDNIAGGEHDIDFGA
jgi:hypothetical protein